MNSRQHSRPTEDGDVENERWACPVHGDVDSSFLLFAMGPPRCGVEGCGRYMSAYPKGTP